MAQFPLAHRGEPVHAAGPPVASRGLVMEQLGSWDARGEVLDVCPATGLGLWLTTQCRALDNLFRGHISY